MDPMQTAIPQIPKELARFPEDAQAAYLRFLQQAATADLHLIVQAALYDFQPSNKKNPDTREFLGTAHLIQDVGLDSLAVTELVFFFEDLFKVSIPSTEILKLRTVSDLETYVSLKLIEKKASA